MFHPLIVPYKVDDRVFALLDQLIKIDTVVIRGGETPGLSVGIQQGAARDNGQAPGL